MSSADILDISPPLSTRSAVFPGDTEFRSEFVMRMRDGGSCDVSTVTMSVHTGAHADAPSHFSSFGATIDQVPLDAYLGVARVVDLRAHGAIGPRQLAELKIAGVSRLLLKTGSAPDSEVFSRDAAYLTALAAASLAGRRLRLFGIDTASVDRWDSKRLAAHRALARGGIAILENLVLAHVPAGDYELIALPLRLVGLDASPVRAVLRAIPVSRRGRGPDSSRSRSAIR